MIIAQENGRTIPKEDKIFAINGRAKAMIAEKGQDAVVNATIGALLDDNGKLIVMESVMDAIRMLTPADYAEYAPISGIPAFKEAVKKALFGSHKTDRFVEVCASPGGTGSLRNTISNYSQPGDKIMTSDWFWAGYTTIVGELGRSIATYELFTKDGAFNAESFAETAEKLIDEQGRLVIILNTPAHNPTGYSLTDEDWDKVVESLNRISSKGPVTLLIDAAYIDFAGDEEEYRSFFKKVELLNEHVLPLVAYSASKTLTLYGMRTGALVCMAPTAEIAEEFRRCAEYSSRGSWSNCVRAGQTVLANIYASDELVEKVAREREYFRNMLIARGKAFEAALREEGVENVPFDAGFFTCIEHEDPNAISAALEEQGIFTVPLAKGVRVSVASISEEKCVKTAKAIAKLVK